MLHLILKANKEAEKTPVQARSDAMTIASQEVTRQIQAVLHQVQKPSEYLTTRIESAVNRLKQLSHMVDQLAVKAEQALLNSVSACQKLDVQIRNQQGMHAVLNTEVQRQAQALSGNIALYEMVGNEEVSAAELNAAVAGAFEREISVSLVSEVTDDGVTTRFAHPWALFPVVLSAEAVSDPDVQAPTVQNYDDPVADPVFVKGILKLRVIFDTDAGATKTYAVGNTVTVTVKTASDSKLLGWPVADLVKTYTVVA